MASFLVKTSEQGSLQGPFNGRELKHLVESGQLRAEYLVSQDDGITWHPASRFSGLEFVDPDPSPVPVVADDVPVTPAESPEPDAFAEPSEAAVVDQAPVVFTESHWKRSLAFSPSGDCLAIGSQGVVTLWDIRSREVQRVIRGKRGADVESMAFSADGRQIVVCFEDDYKGRVFDSETGKRVALLEGGGNEVTVHGVADDDSMITTNGWTGTVDRWDLESGEKTATLVAYPASTTEVGSLAVTPDDAFLVTCREDDEDLRIFSLESGKRIGVGWAHESAVEVVAASPLSNVVASGDEDGTIVLWNIPAGEVIRKIDTELGKVVDLVFSPCGTRLLVTGYSDCVLVLDVDDLSTVRRLELEQDPDQLVLSPDGNLLACNASSEGVVLWHLGSSYDSLDEVVRVSAGDVDAGEYDADDEDDEDDEEESDSWDEDDDPIDGEEEIEGVFDSEGWSLAIEGTIGWPDLLEVVGTPREASLLSTEQWRSAQAENRVLTISHVEDGMQYAGRVGLHRGQNYCRVAVGRSMPDGLEISDVDIADIDRDFDAVVRQTADMSVTLIQACRDSDVDAVRQALANGADINHHDYESGMTSLKAAIAGGSVDVVKLLIEEGIGPDSGSEGWTMAISSGQPEIAAVLAESGVETEPQAALLEACRLGQSDAVGDMLLLINDINESVTVWGDQHLEGTPLTVAAAAGRIEIVGQLIEAGADTSRSDSRNVTAWAAAAARGQRQVCDLLESDGVQVDVQLALLVAAECGEVEIAESLIERGADVNAVTGFGDGRATALETVVASDTIEVNADSADLEDDNEYEVIEARRLELFEMLLGHGGNLDTVDADGRPLLHDVVSHNRSACLRKLAEMGADLEATDSEGNTAVIIAASRGDDDMLGRLLFRGANPNVSDSDGRPALLQMFDEYSQCSAEIAKWLVAYGVDLEATDPQGQVLEQLCERVLRKGADDDEYSYEQAEAILELLRDPELFGRFHGLLSRTADSDDSCLEQVVCAVDLLESTDLAYSLVSARVSQSSDHADGLLGQLFAHDDWRYRFAAALSLVDAAPAAEELLPLMLDNLADPDEDVREAISRAIAVQGPEVVDTLIDALTDRPADQLQALHYLINIIDPGRGPDVRLALENMLPEDPEGTRGGERLRAGIVLGMLGTFHAEDDESAAAMSLYERSVMLNPDLLIGFWGELAALKSSQGDDALQQAIELYNSLSEVDNFEEWRGQLENCIEAAPEFPWSVNNLAWALATSTEQSIRDGERAVELATRLCEQDQWQYHSFLDTLAAAFSETGDFDKAVELVGKAIEVAPIRFRDEYQDNLERYQAGQAWPIGETEDDEDDSEWVEAEVVEDDDEDDEDDSDWLEAEVVEDEDEDDGGTPSSVTFDIRNDLALEPAPPVTEEDVTFDLETVSARLVFNETGTFHVVAGRLLGPDSDGLHFFDAGCLSRQEVSGEAGQVVSVGIDIVVPDGTWAVAIFRHIEDIPTEAGSGSDDE